MLIFFSLNMHVRTILLQNSVQVQCTLGLTRDLIYSVSVGLGTQTFGTGRYRYSLFFRNSGSVGLGTQLYGIGRDSKFRELSNYRS